MVNVIKFVQIVPEIKTDRHNNGALYTVYPNMHVLNLKFQYICADTCGVSIYSSNFVADGCPHSVHHKKTICKIEGEEDVINLWTSSNGNTVTLLSDSEADALGKVLSPEHQEKNILGETVTVPQFNINDWL